MSVWTCQKTLRCLSFFLLQFLFFKVLKRLSGKWKHLKAAVFLMASRGRSLSSLNSLISIHIWLNQVRRRVVFHPEWGRVSGTEVKGHSTQTTVVRGSVWLKWTDAMFLLSNVRAGPLNREHVKSVNLLTQLFTGLINSSHQSDCCIQQQECSECILVLNHWHFSKPAFLTNNLNINRLNQIRRRAVSADVLLQRCKAWRLWAQDSQFKSQRVHQRALAQIYTVSVWAWELQQQRQRKDENKGWKSENRAHTMGSNMGQGCKVSLV